VRYAQVKVRLVKGDEELSVVCIKVVVEGKSGDESTEWGRVLIKRLRTGPWGSLQEEELNVDRLLSHWTRKDRDDRIQMSGEQSHEDQTTMRAMRCYGRLCQRQQRG